MAYMDSYYQLSLNILKALGGDTSIAYPDADDIWVEINKIYDHAGNRFDIVPLEKIITENGQYDYYPDNDADAFMPVNIHVDVPQKYTDEQVFEIESNAIQQGYNQGYTVGESNGILIGQEQGYADGYNEGIEIQRGKLTTITITENGVYTREDGYNEVTVEVAGEGGITDEELQEMLKDAMDDGYQDGYVDGVDDGMEEGYASGKVDGYNEGELRGARIQKEKLTSLSVSENGTYTREDGYNEVIVEIETPTFVTESLNVELKENKTYTYTPTTDGYNSVSIKVDVPTSGGTGLDWSETSYNETDIRICNGFIEDDIKRLATFKLPTTSSWNNGFKWSDHRFLPRTIVNSNITSIRDLFAYSALVYVPSFDSNNATGTTYSNTGVFGYNYSLRKVGDLYFRKVSSLSRCFKDCYNLESIDSITTSEALTDTSYMFDMFTNGLPASKLTSVPLFDTSNVTTMEYMFRYCKSLTTIPQFNTSNVKYMSNMFSSCENLVSIPELDCSSATSMSYMLQDCKKLRAINLLNTGNVTDMGTMCQNTNALVSICELDCSSVQKLGSFFGSSTTNMYQLINLGGFKNLGQYSSLTGTNNNYFLYRCPNLTKESVLNMLNGLYDRAAAGYPVLTLKMHANHLAMLSDEEKAIATNKGWTLS